MKDKIEVLNQQKKVILSHRMVNVCKRVIRKVLEVERPPFGAEVALTFTCNKKIKEVNSEFRGKDTPTDVLSFPQFNFTREKKMIVRKGDVEDGCAMLGDILISAEKAQEQALEFGHSLERELAYLTVHSMYHLFGYDHMVEEEKAQMREKEEQIMSLLGIER